MISEKQFQNLPEVLKEIVTVDRDLQRCRKDPLVPLMTILRLTKRRAELRKAAADRWGYLGGKKGPENAMS